MAPMHDGWASDEEFLRYNRDLRWRDRVFTDTSMTNRQLGFLVSIILTCTFILAWVMWPAPNLDGLTAYEKCDYSSYARTHGGTVEDCHAAAAANARARLGGDIPAELQTN